MNIIQHLNALECDISAAKPEDWADSKVLLEESLVVLGRNDGWSRLQHT